MTYTSKAFLNRPPQIPPPLPRTHRLSAAPSFRVRSARDIGALPGAGEEEQTSRSAVKGALQVLKARDSSVRLGVRI